MAAAALFAVQAASTLAQVAGQQSQARSIRRQTMAESDLLTLNADVGELQAKDAESRGLEQASVSRQQTRGAVGSQRAAMGAEGIDLTSGSAADVLNDTASLGALDELTIRLNARREAWGYRVGAASDRLQAAMTREAGRNAARSLRLQSGVSLLTGAASAYGSYRANR
jgi:hypothetical protein